MHFASKDPSLSLQQARSRSSTAISHLRRLQTSPASLFLRSTAVEASARFPLPLHPRRGMEAPAQAGGQGTAVPSSGVACSLTLAAAACRPGDTVTALLQVSCSQPETVELQVCGRAGAEAAAGPGQLGRTDARGLVLPLESPPLPPLPLPHSLTPPLPAATLAGAGGGD